MVVAALGTSNPLNSDEAVNLCRSQLARKVGGDIQDVTATSLRKSGHVSTLKGEVTAFIGMGPPQSGSASAHHLIRAEFEFRCKISGGRIRRVTVSPRQ